MSLTKLEALISLMATILPDQQGTIDKYQDDPEFAKQIDSLFKILSEPGAKNVPKSKKHRSRRNTGVIDPFELFKYQGDQVLRQQLQALQIEQLKDIIAEHGMDSTRRAMSWKKSERLIELIIQTVKRRDRRGDAFR